MGIKKVTKQLATGAAGVVLASSGCSCGDDNGAVDPAPEPLVCSNVDQGQSLRASAELTGHTLEVRISDPEYHSRWIDAEVSRPVNVSVTEVRLPDLEGPLVIVFELAAHSVTTGSFELRGALEARYGYTGSDCDLTRTFMFEITGTNVLLAELSEDQLPLATRHRTVIAMVNRDGESIELEAKSNFPGACALAWSVSGGELVSAGGDRAYWQLPDKKGFYQAQVVADFGEAGLAFDTINLEVV